MGLLFRRIFLFQKIALLALLMVSMGYAQERPSLLGSFPREGSEDILRNAFVSIKFSRPHGDLNIATVNEKHIKLYPTAHPEQAVPAYLTLDNALRTLILEPLGMLEANTSYTFEITEGVKDQVGNAFVATRFQFETGEKAFRKLISMDRPFADKPAAGTWREMDVSGEDLEAPYLREPTPKRGSVASTASTQKEETKVGPELNKQELLQLVLRLYGGVKLPEDAKQGALSIPSIPSPSFVEMQEPIYTLEEMLVALSDVSEISDSLADGAPQEIIAASDPQVKQQTASQPLVKPSVADDQSRVAQPKPSFDQLSSLQWQSLYGLQAPRASTVPFVASRVHPQQLAAFERALQAMNEAFIQEVEQERLEIAAQQAAALTAKTPAVQDSQAMPQLAKVQVEQPNTFGEIEAIEKAPSELSNPPTAQADVSANEEHIDADHVRVEETVQKAAFGQLSNVQWHDPYKLKAPSISVISFVASRVDTQQQIAFESALQAMNEALIKELEQERLEIAARQASALVAKAPAAQDSQAAPQLTEVQVEQSKPHTPPEIKAKEEAPNELAKPQTTQAEVSDDKGNLDTGSLLVEETVRNPDRAGKIRFPQTAIFINEYVVVEFELPEREFVSFILRDAQGEVYRTEGGYVEAGFKKRAVTLDNIPPGSYEAVVETIHQKVVRKLTIVD